MKSAICLIVRNEARNIAEWIAFHAVAGFDTQIIFDNRSDDDTAAIIKAASKLYDIRYHYWQDSSQRSQVAAYEAACQAYKLEFDWIAFLDSDEFLVPHSPMGVNDMLASFEGWSGIGVNWAIFGANGHEDFPPGLVMEHFTRRSTREYFANRHVKSIIRPGFAAGCINPHCFDLRGDSLGSYCSPAGRSMRWWPAPEQGGIVPGISLELPDYGIWRVNHYFTRSRAHWLAKLKRGYPSDVAIRKMAEFDEYNRNDIEDLLASAYAAPVAAAVERINTAAPRGAIYPQPQPH